MSEPLAGNHNDLYNIEVQFEVVTQTLETADIAVDGLFINADAGFDSKDFRKSCNKKQINANIYATTSVMQILTAMIISIRNYMI